MSVSSVTAVVLCGGRSRRFGTDKTRASLHGLPLLDHVLAGVPRSWTVLCVGPSRPTVRAVGWVREDPAGGGPNAAIAAALPHVDSPLVVVLAADMPWAGSAALDLAEALAEALERSRAQPPAEVHADARARANPGINAVYARDRNGRVQPLLAAYRTAALRAALPAPPENTPARMLIERVPHLVIDVGDGALDVDTVADLDAALRRPPRLGTMRAVTVPTPGPPEALVLTDLPEPVAGPGEVVVEVVAAGVNRADVMQRLGFYPSPPWAPPYPGLEVSGRVAALGEGVTGWAVGDEVCALLSGGGYAERVAVPAGQLLPVPAGVSLIDAAALPEVVATVWSNVFLTANLQPGQVLLVHGGSSGIGTMAVQLGAAFGARVAVTAGSAAKLQVCRELGAQVLVNYREEDFVERITQDTDGHGADVILDNMGAKYLARNVDALAVAGRLVVIGLQGGAKAELDLGRLLGKRAAVIATSLRARPTAEKATIVAAVREHVWPLVDSGRVRPIVHARYPLAEVVQAHRVMESSTHIGKLLLTL